MFIFYETLATIIMDFSNCLVMQTCLLKHEAFIYSSSHWELYLAKQIDPFSHRHTISLYCIVICSCLLKTIYWPFFNSTPKNRWKKLMKHINSIVCFSMKYKYPYQCLRCDYHRSNVMLFYIFISKCLLFSSLLHPKATCDTWMLCAETKQST